MQLRPERLIESADPQARVGVLLMSFGTASSAGEVPAYLASVRGGRAAPDDLVSEFQRRFAMVGGSPLTRITREQALALEDELNRTGGAARYRVTIGMRHAPPFVAQGYGELATWGAHRVIGLAMSPQYSPIIMGGYGTALEAARGQLAVDVEPETAPSVSLVGAWHDEALFIEAMAVRVRESLDTIERECGESPGRESVPVLFTAHSLPSRVAEQEPNYIAQLQDTAEAIATRVCLRPEQWQFAYQSAGHTPEPWLTPDIKDLFPALHDAGHRCALVAPVQFLADHLEVLYDIDVAAREEAAAHGIQLFRARSLNTLPLFVEALAAVIRRS